jgi:hypothetical protein
MWQMVDFPTRGNNILDLICTTIPDKVTNIIGFDDILSTDHKLISFDLNLRISRKPKIKRVVYNFKKADWDGLNETLCHIPWDMCFVPNDIDSSCSNWCDLFTSAIDAHIPKCLIKNVHNHPWIDTELLSLLTLKLRMGSYTTPTSNPFYFDQFLRVLRVNKNLNACNAIWDSYGFFSN